MPLQVNIRHVKEKEVQLHGQLPVAELDLQNHDELVRTRLPLRYDLTAQMLGDAILVQGRVELTLDCECARCLKPFPHRIVLDPWAAHVPLEGAEKAVTKDDLADLTPYVREDILLELPQRPLCGAGCAGLLNRAKENRTKGARPAEGSPAWSELNKLKF
jgi:uncharacterized protein